MGQLWVQSVSATPATRVDVVNLQEHLDSKLQQRQARETGICPVRRELYSQAFDELIRQVTINCAERGMLLLRVRDEIRMTIAAYQTLYESSVAFGMRKALQAEQGKADMLATIEELKGDKADLEKSVARLNAKCEDIQRLAEEVRAKEVRCLRLLPPPSLHAHLLLCLALSCASAWDCATAALNCTGPNGGSSGLLFLHSGVA